MYNDTIKVANKIISDTDLSDIFSKMNEEIENNNKLCKEEEIQNERYERGYQNWTVKDFDGSFKCRFNFYDDTEIDVDNYNTFLSIFNGRLHEVKYMWIRYQFSYNFGDGQNNKFISKHIYMDIHEHKMSIDASLGSDDDKMQNVFNLIKEKVLTAPEKYDRIIKKKTSITNKVGLAIGLIPSMIICLLLVIIPEIRNFYSNTYVLFPIISLILAYFIGGTIASLKLDKYYAPLMPEKKYAGYDTTNNKSIYKDDIEKFVETSEIIIGKNINNIKNRNEIVQIEEKYSKNIPIELIVLLVASIVVILIGKLL